MTSHRGADVRRGRRHFPLIMAALACGLLLPLVAAPSSPFPLDEEAEAWVRETLAAMTLEQRVGQLLMPRLVRGAATSPEVFEETRRLVEELGLGGITLSVRSAADSVPFLNDLQASSEVPLIVTGNFERGTGHFWSDGTLFPRQMALAATGDPETARLVGEVTGREARSCGVHWVLLPICDVNINPENPIINIRSYGQDPGTVASFAVAFAEGCQAQGVLACAKHFPGHGDTETDSHLALAVVDQELARLAAVELPPFQAVIDAGVASVMTSHIWFPSLMEGEGQVPVTVSRRVLTDLLRGEMGFQGLIISDSMQMQGITDLFDPGEAAVASVAAGVDVLLDPPDARRAAEALVAAVEDGRLTEARIDRSAELILRAKSWLGLHRGAQIDTAQGLSGLRRAEDLAQARELAKRAVTLIRDLWLPQPRSIEQETLSDEWIGLDDFCIPRILEQCLYADEQY